MQGLDKVRALMGEWGIADGDMEAYLGGLQQRRFRKGQRIYSDESECRGLVMIENGALRAYIVGESGKEIDLFVLKDGEFCILSASCLLKNIRFGVNLEFLQDTSALVLPSKAFNALATAYPAAKSFQTELVSERLSRVVDRLDNLAFKSLSERILDLLQSRLAINESAESRESGENGASKSRGEGTESCDECDKREGRKVSGGRENRGKSREMGGGRIIRITHEEIANAIGSVREAVSRNLKSLEKEGKITMRRGAIELHLES